MPKKVLGWAMRKKVLGWAMRKKGIPEVFIRSVMGMYEQARTRNRVDSELSQINMRFLWDTPRICVATFSLCSNGRCCH